MSPCQVALATINGLDRRFHIIFNVFLISHQEDLNRCVMLSQCMQLGPESLLTPES